jgi:hypothetical protein
MIPLSDGQYAAIGRVAVESGTLEREIEEYLERLGTDRKSIAHKGLTKKLKLLRRALNTTPRPHHGSSEFEFVLTMIARIIEKRNTVVHGVWSPVSNAPVALGEVAARGRKVSLRATEVESVGVCLRRARKLLLRLFHDRCPAAVGTKRCPRHGYAILKQEFLRACRNRTPK